MFVIAERFHTTREMIRVTFGPPAKQSHPPVLFRLDITHPHSDNR